LTAIVVFGVYDAQKEQTLPHAVEATQRDAGAHSVIDFGLHFILNKTPYVLDGISDAADLGVTSFKLFMTYKWRGNRMCSDDFIIQAMEKIARVDGLCQLHCENGDVIDYLERRGHGRGPGEAHRLSRYVPGLGGGRSDQPRHRDGPAHRLPRLRGALEHAARPRADQASSGHRTARVDGDVSAVHAAHRGRDGEVGAL